MTVDYWDGTDEDREGARRAILQAAQRVRWGDYRETVEETVAGYRELLREDPDGHPTDLLYEAVDGILVYRDEARDYLCESPNADAYAQEVGDVRGVEVDSIATYALLRDVAEEVGDLEAFAADVRRTAEEEEVGA